MMLTCRSFWCAAVVSCLAVMFPRPASAQCLTDPTDDVRFEVIIQYFDTDPFSQGNSRTNIQLYGPAIGALGAPERRDGTLDPYEQRSTAGAFASGGTLAFDLFNSTQMRARRVDGRLIGNGVTLTVRTYVKGPSGTPWHITESADGFSQADFPAGLGRADACIGSSCASSVNGAGLSAPVPAQTFQFYTGLSTTERIFDDEVFSLARESRFDMWTGFWQSLDPLGCLFSPCPTLLYAAETVLSGQIVAGIGQAPCGGTLSVSVGAPVTFPSPAINCGSCKTIEIPFSVDARFSGDCECCEFRQYIRELNRSASRSWRNPAFRVFTLISPRPTDNHRGDDIQDCLAEDTKPSSGCSSGYRAQGERAEPGSTPRVPRDNSCRSGLFLDSYTDGSGTEDRLGGCFYRGTDSPTWGPIQPNAEYKVSLLFEVLIVAVARDGCWSGAKDLIVARERFNICYEGTMDVSGPTMCSESPSNQWPDFEEARVGIAGFDALVYVSEQDGFLVGSVALSVESVDDIQAADISHAAPGWTSLEAIDGPALSVVKRLGQDAITLYYDFVLQPDGCQTDLSLDLTVLGEHAVVDLDVARFFPDCACPADLSSPANPGQPDGLLSGADFFEFLVRFEIGDLSVDFSSPANPGQPDGVLSGADFFEFLSLFSAGC